MTQETQQNKKYSGVPLVEVLGDYVPVTEHYGFRSERWFDSRYFVIYRNNKVKNGFEICARALRILAVFECEYLENLNFSNF